MNHADTNPPIFVISIDANDGARRENSRQQFENVGMPFTFVEGVTHYDTNSTDIYSTRRNFFWHKRSLSIGEICVYGSHRRAWKFFLDGDASVALITEDDLEIIDTAEFKKVMAAANDHKNWDILKLFDYYPKRTVNSEIWCGSTLVDYKYPASGCVAYLITRTAARRLLSRSKIFRPVDEDFSFCWEFDLCVRSISPNIVDEISINLGGSILEVEREIIKSKKTNMRSIWGNVLQVGKQLRARQYRSRIMTSKPKN